MSRRLSTSGGTSTRRVPCAERCSPRYLDRDPRSLEFAHGPYGKPELRSTATGCVFNSSRSGPRRACSLSRTDVTSAWTSSASTRGARSGPIADQLFAARRGCGASRAAGGEEDRAASSSCGRRRRPTRRRSGRVDRSARPAAGPSRGWSLTTFQLGPDFAGTLCVRGRPAPRPPARMTVRDVVTASTEFLDPQGSAEPARRRGAPRRPCARPDAARSLPRVRPAADGGGAGRLPRARPPTRARASRSRTSSASGASGG